MLSERLELGLQQEPGAQLVHTIPHTTWPLHAVAHGHPHSWSWGLAGVWGAVSFQQCPGRSSLNLWAGNIRSSGPINVQLVHLPSAPRAECGGGDLMGNGTWVFGGPQSGKVRKNMRMDDQPGGLDHKQGAGRREIGAQTAVLVDHGKTWAPGTKETRSPCVCEGRVWGLAQPEAGGSGRVLPGPHTLGRRVIPSGAPGLRLGGRRRLGSKPLSSVGRPAAGALGRTTPRAGAQCTVHRQPTPRANRGINLTFPSRDLAKVSI